ncbi:hypothetical protein LPJ66_004041 [Kickxella alabastrina]|uniref:Uncharacterized protein n=1 Tax=Kickxella alabastrina TaxID=61397 RepID=A0ACC1IKT6_9FUNG|nr:hypothetical protein LPJ66_004041 [Kickxella alabastrina]
MAKSKVLVRTASKSNDNRDDSGLEPTVRPHTAGRERGIFRRLRLGRMLFGLGSGHGAVPEIATGASIGSGPEYSTVSHSGVGSGAHARDSEPMHNLFRTSSAQPQSNKVDLLLSALAVQPPDDTSLHSLRGELGATNELQAVSGMQRQRIVTDAAHQFDARKSCHSLLPRRSSAPDVAEIVRRLSLCTVTGECKTDDDGASQSSETSTPPSYLYASYTSGQPGPSDDGSASTKASTTQRCEVTADMKAQRAHSNYSHHGNSSSDRNTAAATATHHSSDIAHSSTFGSGSHDEGDSTTFPPLPLKLPLPCTRSSSSEPSPRDAIANDTHSRDTSQSKHSTHRAKLAVTTTMPTAAAVAKAETEEAELVGSAAESGSSEALSRGDTSGLPSTTANLPHKATPEIIQLWRQQRQSMPDSPISPSGNGPNRRGASFNAPRGAEIPAVVNPKLMLMGSVKQRGDKKSILLATEANAGKSLLASPSSSSSVLSHASSQTSLVHSASVVTSPGSLSGLSPPMVLLPIEEPEEVVAPNQIQEDAASQMLVPACGKCPETDDQVVDGQSGWTRKPSVHRRPKSLYERPYLKALLASEDHDDEFLSSRASASIASAKAFLKTIASGSGPGSASALPRAHTNPNNLSISTSGSRDSLRQRSFSGVLLSRLPSSAPEDGGSTGFVFGQQFSGDGERSVPSDQESEAAYSYQRSTDFLDKSDMLAASHGNRLLRARSKLAGVGIRRASTYVWSRSSVFMRSLSVSDDIPNSLSQTQSQPQTQLQEQAQPQPQQQLPDRAGEADAVFGSTKITENTEPQGGGLATSDTTTRMDALPTDTRRVSAVPPSYKKSPAAMRLHAARELVMTEKNFVDNLFVIKKVWMEPVFSSANSPKPIIPYQTARVIFFGIAALHSHASQFYREMDFVLGSFERNQSFGEGSADDGMRIGTLFRTNDRHWNEFISYVRNYGTAVNCLKQLQDYKPYQKYHEECMIQKRTNRQSLKDLLMLPIQRITRYTLLLKNILKHTPAVHSDHIELCRAVKNVTHLASIVNECRRKQEEMHRLIEIFRTIERCPPLPHSDSRTYISEFVVRELISRQPTRLLLFTDMVIVTQAPLQTKVDSEGQVDAIVEWSYHGIAQLDQVEVQNADESINTLVTILSLNRNATSSNTTGAAASSGSSRRSLPPGPEPPLAPSSASGSRVFVTSSSQNSISDLGEAAEPRNRASAGSQGHGYGNSLSTHSNSALADMAPADAANSNAGNRKKRSRGRKGLLRANSRDSIPEHIVALSHSTFPSPVSSPMQLNSSASRLNHPANSGMNDMAADKDSVTAHLPQQHQQRPKTSSGYSGTPSSMSLHHTGLSHSSNNTMTNYSISHFADVVPSLQTHHSSDTLPFDGTGSVPPIVFGPTDIPLPDSVHLTLVMQHPSSAARKQFVRALKDATAKYARDIADSNEVTVASNDAPPPDANNNAINLHPL